MEEQNTTVYPVGRNTNKEALPLKGIKPVSTTSNKFMRRLYARMGRESKRAVLAALTTFLPPVIVQFWLHNLLLSGVIFILPFLAWGVRIVPRYHNALLILFWVRRTRIGFAEGMVWVPWFLGARLEFYDVRKRQLDIPKEDNWTTDSMHLVYDIVLQYGIRPIENLGIFRNFFQFFICLFQRQDNADSLYYFSQQEDLKSAVVIMSSVAADLTIQAVNSRRFSEIFRQQEYSSGQQPEKTIQKQVLEELKKEIADIGLEVYRYELKDIDFHEDSAAVLQEKFLARVRGEAVENLYEIIVNVAEKLIAAGRPVADTAIKIEVVEALKNAAEGGGVLGALAQVLTAKQMLPGNKEGGING